MTGASMSVPHPLAERMDPEQGTWGGRVVAALVVDGRLLSSALVAAGHGRSYDGGKREGWCE